MDIESVVLIESTLECCPKHSSLVPNTRVLSPALERCPQHLSVVPNTRALPRGLMRISPCEIVLAEAKVASERLPRGACLSCVAERPAGRGCLLRPLQEDGAANIHEFRICVSVQPCGHPTGSGGLPPSWAGATGM